jgi:hypothetical protein
MPDYRIKKEPVFIMLLIGLSSLLSCSVPLLDHDWLPCDRLRVVFGD